MKKIILIISIFLFLGTNAFAKWQYNQGDIVQGEVIFGKKDIFKLPPGEFIVAIVKREREFHDMMLYQIDKEWRDHLAAMDTLRSSVNLRAMGGKDPFYEYKKESFDYFNDMLSEQNEKVLKTLFNLELVAQNSESGSIKKIDNTNRVLSKKIGRNDPCPCGSGKKYKFCHGN